MNKTRIAIFGLLLNFAIFTNISLMVHADTHSMVFYTPNYWASGVDYDNELEVTSDANYQMFLYGVNYANFQYDYNCQNSSATAAQYASSTNYCENQFDTASVFSKGHAATWWTANHHFLMDWYGDKVMDFGNASIPTPDDYGIYPNTQGNTHFVFLWHCATADPYPSSEDAYGWAGFPYCWTRNNSMDTDGYNSDEGDYVFMGYHYYSHQFLDETDYEDYTYGDFCVLFFKAYFQLNYDVKASLDYASQTAFDVDDFTDTPLCYPGEELGVSPNNFWSWMKIYGNGQTTAP